MIELLALQRRKRHDYASDEDPFSNFRASAKHAGLDDPRDSVEVLIGIKQARLEQLKGKPVKNESFRDTLRDRIVYGMISLAMYDEQQAQNDDDETPGGSVWHRALA